MVDKVRNVAGWGALAAIGGVALGACSGELASSRASDAAAADASVDAPMTPDATVLPEARPRCGFTSWALDQDVIPGSGPVRLDARGSSGQGLTAEDVEAVLCPGKDVPNLLGDGAPTMAWGDIQELAVEYDVATRLVHRVVYRQGYLGSVHLKSSTPDATYEIAVNGRPILKNMAAFVLDWGHPAAFAGQVDELYRAAMETFAPGVQHDPVGTTCIDSGRCHVFLGDADAAPMQASVSFDALGFTIGFENVGLEGATPTRLDQILPP